MITLLKRGVTVASFIQKETLRISYSIFIKEIPY